MGGNRKQNPAAILHEIFKSARGHGPSNTGLTSREVWAKVFQINGKDLLEIAGYLNHVQTLLDKTEILIKARKPSNQELCLRSFPKIRMALKEIGLETGFKAFYPAINDTVMTELEFCEIELGSIEELAKEVDLKEIDDHVNSLFTKIGDSSLREDLKETLLSLLEAIRQAIKKYQIFGASALEEGLEIAIGRIYVKRLDFKEIKENDNEIFDSFLENIRKLEVLVGKISRYKPLLENALPLLLGST